MHTGSSEVQTILGSDSPMIKGALDQRFILELGQKVILAERGRSTGALKCLLVLVSLTCLYLLDSKSTQRLWAIACSTAKCTAPHKAHLEIHAYTRHRDPRCTARQGT